MQKKIVTKHPAMTYDIRKIVSSNIFVVNSSYFPLLYIRCTKFVRWNLFDETGPWSFLTRNKILDHISTISVSKHEISRANQDLGHNADIIPLKMSRNSTTKMVHSVNSFEKCLSLLSVSSNEIGPGSSVGRVSTSRKGRTLGRPRAATYQSR